MAAGRGKISWSVGVGPELITEYAGTTLRAYYTDAEVQLESQRVANERFQELFGVSVIRLAASPPAYVGVAALGATLVYPEDSMPMVARRPIAGPRDVSRMRIPPSYLKHPAMAPFVEMHAFMSRRLGPRARVGLGGGWEGPVTSAVLLRGQEFFTDLYLNPGAAHALLATVTQSIVAFEREVRELLGRDLDEGVGICDDFAGLISPAMFPDFVLPYWETIYNAFGPAPRSLHSELLRKDHLALLDEIGLTHVNFGEDQYLTVRDVVSATKIPFSWNVRTIEHMLRGTPETVRRAFMEAVRDGATELTTDLCARGIPLENIRAFVEVARKTERGPVMVPAGPAR